MRLDWKRGDWKRGSFTVEATAVMPIVLFVLFATILLCFHVHNRCWLIGAAEEAALCGSMAGVTEDGKVRENAEMRTRELGEGFGFPGSSEIQGQVAVGDQVTVTYDGITGAGVYGLLWNLHVRASRRIFRPTEELRKKALSHARRRGGGSE